MSNLLARLAAVRGVRAVEVERLRVEEDNDPSGYDRRAAELLESAETRSDDMPIAIGWAILAVAKEIRRVK